MHIKARKILKFVHLEHSANGYAINAAYNAANRHKSKKDKRDLLPGYYNEDDN